MMHKEFIMASMFAAFLSTTAQAIEDPDLKHFSLTINAVPGLQNAADSNVPGTENISDIAYQYQLNYNKQIEAHHTRFFEQRLEYYSLRAFAYRYTLVNGLGHLQGGALLYGQRYLLDSKGYQGFGLGWQAGLASVTDTRVQKCCALSSERNLMPIVAAEAFYKFKITSNIFIEPSMTITWRASGETVYYATPALTVGGEF